MLLTVGQVRGAVKMLGISTPSDGPSSDGDRLLRHLTLDELRKLVPGEWVERAPGGTDVLYANVGDARLAIEAAGPNYVSLHHWFGDRWFTIRELVTVADVRAAMQLMGMKQPEPDPANPQPESPAKKLAKSVAPPPWDRSWGWSHGWGPPLGPLEMATWGMVPPEKPKQHTIELPYIMYDEPGEDRIIHPAFIVVDKIESVIDEGRADECKVLYGEHSVLRVPLTAAECRKRIDEALSP